VRVVAATNRVNQALVEDEILREDLFYRLMVFPLLLPPLRARRSDIPELTRAVLDAWNRDHKTALRCPERVMEQLKEHDWPGNVRELKHTVQRMAIMSEDGALDSPDFFDQFASSQAAPPLAVGSSIKDVEQRLILATLEHFDWDKRRTATTLGISEKTLYNRLKMYGEEATMNPSEDCA
jgi:DNA-binding NtrC family response regulator